MQSVSFRRLCATLSACACLLAASAGFAQDYPNRRITLLVGFAAGSGADILARYYASELASETGQVVVVENKPGANGIIAAQTVKHAKPDGYTLLFAPSAGMAGGKFLYANLPYDPEKDFIVVAPLLDVAFALAVGAKSPARSVSDLTALLRAKTGARYGTSNSTAIAATEVYKRSRSLMRSRSSTGRQRTPWEISRTARSISCFSTGSWPCRSRRTARSACSQRQARASRTPPTFPPCVKPASPTTTSRSGG